MKLRLDRKPLRQKEAAARQTLYDRLTPQQKLDRLDKLFGKGKGGPRQRPKLLAQIENAKHKKPEVDKATKPATTAKPKKSEKKSNKYRDKKRAYGNPNTPNTPSQPTE